MYTYSLYTLIQVLLYLTIPFNVKISSRASLHNMNLGSRISIIASCHKSIYACHIRDTRPAVCVYTSNDSFHPHSKRDGGVKKKRRKTSRSLFPSRFLQEKSRGWILFLLSTVLLMDIPAFGMSRCRLTCLVGYSVYYYIGETFYIYVVYVCVCMLYNVYIPDIHIYIYISPNPFSF